jgi:hypothetical protein
MYPLAVATPGNGKNAKPVGASLLAMLVPLAISPGSRQKWQHLPEPDRQQAGSYKRAACISNT